MALARLYRSVAVGDRVRVVAPGPRWTRELLRDLLVGAGLAPGRIIATDEGLLVHATRELSLPDTVGPRMAILVCGLNPSVYAAEAGVGFARPGNRYWPAALAAGIVTVDRDPDHALRHHGVGMTDVVKRATPRADALATDEYRAGLAQLDRLVAWLRPGAVCFVGLTGWRALYPKAVAGVQPDTLGGRPVYVLPSTSGLNARVPLAELARHLADAHRLGVESRPRARSRRRPTRFGASGASL
jgi:TDG/mug DNA glycosylase family protein